MSLFDYDPALKRLASGNTNEEKLEIIPFDQIASAAEKLLEESNIDKIFKSQADAYVSFSKGDFNVLPIQTIGQPPVAPLLAGQDAQCCIKTGYVTGSDFFVAKVAAGGGNFHGNTGCILLFSQKTMRLVKILEDEGILTEIRTAAASCLASKLFLPKKLARIGIIGGGVQAVWQLRFLSTITPVRKILLLTRSCESAEKFKKQMKQSNFKSDREWEIDIAKDESEFVSCQLIHTLTCSREAVLKTVSDEDEVHITAVGADTAGKQELDVESVAKKATVLCCDNIEQSVTRGEFQHLHKVEPQQRYYPIGELLAKLNGRLDTGALRANGELYGKDGKGLTIFDTSGVAVQDAAMAGLVGDFL